MDEDDRTRPNANASAVSPSGTEDSASAAPPSGDVEVDAFLGFEVRSLLKSLDDGPWITSPTLAVAMIVATPMAVLVLVLICLQMACRRKRACHACHECVRRCARPCRQPLAERDVLARGPDSALEEDQDEFEEVDSVDEPMRRTPPATDGEEDECPIAGAAVSPCPNRARCETLATAAGLREALGDGNGDGNLAKAPEVASTVKVLRKKAVGFKANGKDKKSHE